jgi:1-acyl-sn-glycerol-3-phosphate acyltransferase
MDQGLKASYLAFGLPIKIWYSIALWFGLLQIYGEENIPNNPQRLVIVANHPSKFIQPLLLLGLFRKYFKDSARTHVPRIAADIDNFVRNPLFSKLRATEWFIPVNRAKRDEDESLKYAHEAAQNDWNQMWFPGGTRDWKATKSITTKNGKTFGRFRPGFAIVTHDMYCPVLPIWYERRGLVVHIVIGKIMLFSDCSKSKICMDVQKRVADLADSI